MEVAAVDRPNGTTDIIFQMSRTLASANRYLTHLMAESGLAGLVPSHGSILVQLRESAEPVTMAHLAEAIGKDPSTATALVRKLVDLGYVSTARCPEDRRVTKVSLTSKGWAVLPRMDDVSTRIMDLLLGSFTSQELSDIREHLMVMGDVLNTACARAKARD